MACTHVAYIDALVGLYPKLKKDELTALWDKVREEVVSCSKEATQAVRCKYVSTKGKSIGEVCGVRVTLGGQAFCAKHRPKKAAVHPTKECIPAPKESIPAPKESIPLIKTARVEEFLETKFDFEENEEEFLDEEM